jgi:hypothetical protein
MRKKICFIILALASIFMAEHCGATGKDLRPLFAEYGIGIYAQGSRGTCSIFALTGVLEFEYARASGQYSRLSVEYLNWASNRLTGEPEDGSYFSDALTALDRYGICSEELFPYYSGKFYQKAEPSATAMEEARERMTFNVVWIKDWDPNTGMSDEQLGKVKNLLMEEHPVAIGFRWPKNEKDYRTMVNGIMTIPPEEGVFDGHSVIIVGFMDDPGVAGGGYFIFKNSAGEEYGENGYGKMPYEYVMRYANDGVAIRPGN